MSIAANLFWGYVDRWGNRIISLIVFIIIARILEPRDIGLVAFAKVLIDYIDSVAAQGLGLAIIQRKELNEDHLSTAFWIVVLLGLILSALLYFSSFFIESFFFRDEGIKEILQVLAILVITNSLSRIQVALLTRQQRFRDLAYRGIAMSLAGGIVGVGMAMSGFGVWSLVFQHISGSVVALLILWGTVAWRPRMLISRTSAISLYSFSSKIFVEQQLKFFSARFDEFLVAVLLSTTALGYYSIAKRLFSTLAEMIFSVLAKVLLADFSKSQDCIVTLASKLNRVTTFVAAFTLPLFVGGAIVGDQMIQVFFGEKWFAAGLPLSFLMVSGIFMLTPNMLHVLFYSLGKPEITLKLNFARALLSVLLVIIGSKFGLTGITAGIMVCSIIGAVLDTAYLRQTMQTGWQKFISLQCRYLLLCTPMVFVVVTITRSKIFDTNHFIALITSIFLGGFVYAVTLLVFKDEALFGIKQRIQGVIRH